MFVDEDEDLMRRFYTDLTDAAVFSTPVPFLQKYTQITDYATVAHSERELLRLLQLAVSRDIDKASRIAELLIEEGADERVAGAVAGVAVNKFADIRRELLRRESCRGGPCLLDHNWRIVNVLSTNWTASANRTLLGLTLIVEQQQRERRINLELDVHEAEQMLNKLKEIKAAFRA